MDEWDKHTMELERESMDRQGEAIEIRLSSLGLAGAMLGEQEIERLQAENARLREALDKVRAERENAQSQLIAARERLIDINNQAVMELPATEDTNRETLEWIIRRAKVDFDLLKEDESWLERHDEEVRGEMLGYILDALPQLVEWGQPRENLGVADVNAIIRRTLQKARAQERERCQWVALEHNAPELIEAARIIAAAIGEADDAD